ncbi:MAG: hypothetical protein BWY64_04080 [bacterium ADurb.Bin363]|nr:MAG: hypothetical protein BWY64_04080 [bacterium ADurb.Bin363]
MEERMIILEKELQNFKQEINERLEHIEDCLKELIKEVRITNNTLQGVFNLGYEFLKLGVKQVNDPAHKGTGLAVQTVSSHID